MLPARSRLNRSGLTAARQQGRRVTLPSLTLYLLSGVEATKVGLSTPKTLSKTSVGRHTLRRRLYQAIRPLLPNLPRPFHIVLAPRGGAVEKKTIRELTDEIAHGLRETGLR